jgi:hypothetical protein
LDTWNSFSDLGGEILVDTNRVWAGRTGNPPLALRFDADFVVHGDSQLLLAAKIDFGGLDRYMPEEKLDLVKFPSCQMTQTGAGRRKSWGAGVSTPGAAAALLTTSQSTFGVMP